MKVFYRNILLSIFLLAPTVACAQTITLVSLTLGPNKIGVGGTTLGLVEIDQPAPAGGVVVNLSITPGNAGILPSTLTIPDSQTSASFSYTDSEVVNVATITATLGLSILQAQVSIASSQTISGFSAIAPQKLSNSSLILTGISASSGLTVIFTSSDPSVASISGNTINFLSVGSSNITAKQAGDNNYLAAPDVSQMLTINKDDQTITFNALTAKTFGNAPFALSGTSTSGLTISYASSDPLVATIIGNMVTIVGVGTTIITASQAGNASFEAAINVEQVLQVGAPITPPTEAPVATAATAITQTGFTANWGGVTGATGYQLDVSSDNFATNVVGFSNLAVAGTSSAVTGLTPNTAYKFRVRATSASPTSTNSNVIDVSTLPLPNAAPVATAATTITQTGFTANWNAVATATGYQLDVSADNFATLVTGFDNLAVTTTNKAVTGLTANTAYKYRVRATGTAPTSVNSNVIDVTTLPVPVVAAPVATAATDISSTGFTANWNPVTGATGYRLDVSADNFVNLITGFADKTVAGTSDVVTGLTLGTAYKYRVRAVDATSTSVNSNVIDVTTTAKQDQTITFAAIPDKTLGDAPFAIAVTASSGLTVNLASASDKVTIAAGVVTLVKAGRETIEASQPGNVSFNPAGAVRSFCIKPAKPTITVSGANTETPTLTSNAISGNQWFKDGTAIAGAINSTLSVTTVGVYKVQVKVDDCISEFSSDTPLIITGDLNWQKGNITIYPNPVEDFLEVRGLMGQVNSSQLIDVTGRTNTIVLEKKDDTHRANVQHLAQGVYLMRVQEGVTVHQIKFIKK